MLQSIDAAKKNLQNSLSSYFADHGYFIESDQLEKLIGERGYKDFISGFRIRGKTANAIDFLISQESRNEDVLEMPRMYEELVDFIQQVPKLQKIQLKPLLFAFFYHTVVCLFDNKKVNEAKQFFEKYHVNEDGSRAFHPVHDTDLKKLGQYLSASSLSKNQEYLSMTRFTTSLTETTYQALVAFLMDRQFTYFLRILNEKVNIRPVNVDHFTSRNDLDSNGGFIFHSTDKAEQTVEPLIGLLSDEHNIIEMAKIFSSISKDNKELKPIDFKIFDDTQIHIDCAFSLPNVSKDRVSVVASDLSAVCPLTKTKLPSCAYFTFQEENTAYDINNSGLLIGVAMPKSSVKIFSTNYYVCLKEYPIDKNSYKFDGSYKKTFITPKTYCLRFSPESKLLLCGQLNKIQLWDCESATPFSQIKTSSYIIWCADWSPLGYHFATGSDNCIGNLWAIDRSKPLRMFINHQEPITAIKFHPNASTIVTASYDRAVMLWDIRSNESICTRIFAESLNVPRCVEFTRNGRIVISGDEGGRLSIWDIGEGRKIGNVKDHKGEVRDLAVSVEGTILASAGSDGDINLWDMSTLCSTSASNAEPLKRYQPKDTVTDRISFCARNLLHGIGTKKKH